MTELCFNLFNESAYFGPTPDLERQIRAAAAAGFDSVGLDTFSLARLVQTGGRIEAIAELIRSLGLRCPEIAALLIDDDPAQTEAQLAPLEQAVRILRPDWILVNSNLVPSAQTAGEFRRAADRLGALGTGLAVEYLAISPGVRSIAGALELIDRSGAANAGVLVDTWHFFLGPDDWEDLAKLPLERLAYVQFDDHPAITGDDLREETLHRRVLPGEGLFDLERFSRTLRARGFDGLVSVEVLSQAWRGGDAEAFVREAHRSTAPFWR
ncbi:MAG: sugar phosphate isomerase/epimerase family protein [Myxococcota bacterium]